MPRPLPDKDTVTVLAPELLSVILPVYVRTSVGLNLILRVPPDAQ